MTRRPLAYLADIVDACEAIESFLAGVDLDAYCAAHVIRSAVERQLILIGEAVGSLLRLDPSLSELISHARRKVVLGMVQTASENTKVCRQFPKSLVNRGLAFGQGLLCVLEGAKGFHAAVREVFGSAALIQRCRWHKRENVLAHLSESRRPAMRRKLQAAYEQPTYDKAKAALQRVRSELALVNQSAAGSLDEGLEETLTLHRIGLAEQLRWSFATTHAIESIQAHIGRLSDHVDHYRNSEQKQRWVGTALLGIEPRLRCVRGMKHLPALRVALQHELGITKPQAAA